ncbi:MAG: hypothetical protein IRY96_04395, partial [Burkholderiales bacterium]|nr:hypothetical protein [Burkholderiales bacterium]
MALASILGRLFSPGVHTARPVSRADGPHKNLLVALIADDFTRTCLEHECRVINVTPQNYETALAHYKPDLLFVESAWFGYRRAWQRRIASYPDRPDPGNADLVRVVEFAKDRGVPAVFWNKEDPVHFERFIDSARLFDVIFTVDANSVDRYKRAIGRPVRVHP